MTKMPIHYEKHNSVYYGKTGHYGRVIMKKINSK
jgi:hypothetical protein